MHCIYFPPEVGGLESHVHYLCRGMVEAGHQVDIVTSRSQPDLPAHEVMRGIGVWRTLLPSRTPPGWAIHSLGSVPRVMELARKADVLHAQAFASVLPCELAARRFAIPLVATFHTSHFLARAEKPLWRPILRRLVEWPGHSFASSEEIAAVAGGLAPGRTIEPLVNGVETTVFRRTEPTIPNGRGPRIVVPRRLFEKNGVEHFVRAFPRIVEKIAGVEAVVIGDGPERDRLEGLAGALGVADRLRFLGARPHREMPGLLSSAEVAVFPSLMEATSVAALECMACEVPVAASRVGGLPEIVSDEVGTLFEPADSHDLADRVVALLLREDFADLGKRARAGVVERWSNARLVARHLELYERLVREDER